MLPQFIFIPPPMSCLGLCTERRCHGFFSLPFYFSAWGRRPSHSFTCRTLRFAQARRGSATNDSDRDNWDWLQTHFVSSVVHRAVCVFCRSVTSWHECWRGAIRHVGVDKYSNQPLLFFFLVFCLVISVWHLCSPAHLLLIHSVRVPHCSTAKVAIHLAPFVHRVINCLNLSISCSNCTDGARMSPISRAGSWWPGGGDGSCNTSVPVRGADRVGGEETIQRRGGRRGLEKETAPGRTSQQGQWDRLQLDCKNTLTRHFIR